MQQDRSPDDVRVNPWIPAQRTGSAAQPPQPTEPVPQVPQPEPVTARPVPADSANDQTVVLPVFVTGKKPVQPPAHEAMADSRLPSSERGMLLFVAALLGLGTIAVVAMMGFGFARGGGPVPQKSAAAPSPSAVALPPPSPAPVSPSAELPSPTPGKPSPTHSPRARHSPTPGPSALGTLSVGTVLAYCRDTNNGMAWPPSRGRATWTCVGNGNRQDFTPTDVCQWQYHDGGAHATVGDIADPSTWRCYT